MNAIAEKSNPLFAKFDDVMKSVLRVPAQTGLGSFWGRRKKLTFADLFCGIGGFHAAADELEMECVFACDIDEEVRTIYKENYGIKPEGDICQINAADIPDHDILCAGFPCQSFSIIGSGAGFRIKRRPPTLSQEHVLRLARFEEDWIEPVTVEPPDAKKIIELENELKDENSE